MQQQVASKQLVENKWTHDCSSGEAMCSQISWIPAGTFSLRSNTRLSLHIGAQIFSFLPTLTLPPHREHYLSAFSTLSFLFLLCIPPSLLPIPSLISPLVCWSALTDRCLLSPQWVRARGYLYYVEMTSLPHLLTVDCCHGDAVLRLELNIITTQHT